MKTVRTPRTRISPALRPPRVSVRWRLTLLYGALFLICSAALLAITYKLFANFAFSYPPKRAAESNPMVAKLASALSGQRPVYLGHLLVDSGIALAIMAIVSLALGWLVAGRVLAPIRAIAATAERISDANLHERIVMAGPRDELRLLADTIDRLLDRLEAAFNAQRQFVANASHELRTPLAMMRTTLDVAVAKPGGVTEQTRELDAELRVDLDYADQLLESFLTLARGQNGQLEERDQVALKPLITTALTAQADHFTAQDLVVKPQLAAVEVAGSDTLLRRMVENLIDNALRHTQPGGSIGILLAPLSTTQAQLTIDSSGPMLDQDAVAQLAQPFKRLSQDRTGSQDGHGLGLAIVAAVAAAHDGRLDLHARPEGGLRVQITLPAATPQLTAAAR